MTERRDQGPRRPSAGQALPFFAVALPALMLLMALGVDAAYLYSNHRRAQGAADLAALAGARLLPDVLSATARANAIAAANGFTSGVTVTTPYAGRVDRIEVRISTPVKPFFMPIAGVQSVAVSARAVAARTVEPPMSYAIFAGATGCNSASQTRLNWGANNIVVTGEVHSNGGITVTGNNGVASPVTFSCAGQYSNSGNGNIYVPPPALTATRPWPINYGAADFPCTYHRDGLFDVDQDGPWWVGGKAAFKQLNPGVYCAGGTNGVLRITKGARGTVTFVATGQVVMSGSNYNLSAHTHGVLAYAQGTAADTIKLNGNNGVWLGVFYAPNGGIDFIGNSDKSVNGALVANTVVLSGQTMKINAAVVAAPEPKLTIVE